MKRSKSTPIVFALLVVADLLTFAPLALLFLEHSAV
jgi:hypothetical protein